jgi:hypothetical protein
MRFLNTKNVRLAEIRRRIVEVSGEGAMNRGNVRKWCRLFKEGRTNVHAEEPSGRPSLVTDGLTEGVNANIRYNEHFIFGRPQSEEGPVAKNIVQDWLLGFPANFSTEAPKSRYHDMTSAVFLLGDCGEAA